MALTNLYKRNCFFLALVLLLLFLASCKKDKETRQADVSPAAKKIFDHLLSISGESELGEQAIADFVVAFDSLKNPSVKDVFEKYRIIANYYVRYKPDAAKVELYADSMLYALKNKEDSYKEEYVSSLFYKGEAEALKKNYELAFRYYYEAREFSIEHFDKCAYFTTTLQLGMIRYRQERYTEAMPYIRQAVNQSYGCKYDGRFAQRQGIVNTLALCFERTNQLDSAIFFYKQALSVIDEETRKGLFNARTSQAAKGVVYGNMGGAYAQLNQFEIAEQYLKKSIDINDRPGYEPIDAQTAKLKLAALYMSRNRLDAARALLRELQQILTGKNPTKEMPIGSLLKLYKLQWEYAKKANSGAEALTELKKYYHLRDSLNRADKDLKTADLDFAFKNHSEKDKLALMAKDSEIKRNYLIASVIFSVMVVAILLLVWLNHRKLKALNNEITTQNTVMQKTLSALEQSQKENTRMMKIVAHDLRNPIVATISIAELLKLTGLSEANHEIVSLLGLTNQQSLDMIDNLLSINAKPDELNIETVNMLQFLENNVSLLQFKADEKDLKLQLDAQEIEASIDGGKIWRVFSNLITNAIKFSPPGATIAIAMQEKPDTFVVSISDEGIGIPDGQKNNIFNIYTEARRQGTSGEQSFGLGLAISKQIIEAHHGQIWVESEVGKGSTFFVELSKITPGLLAV